MTSPLFKTFAWLGLAAIVFVTVSPIGLRPHDFLPVEVDRAGAFAVLALLFVIAYPRHWAYCAALLLVSAFGIELLQWLSPTRHPEVRDALVKAIGAAIGCTAGWTINQIRFRPRTA